MAKSCGATQPGADRFSYPSKRRIPPVVTYLILALSIVGTGLLWRAILAPQAEPAPSIIPGEFPKKIDPPVNTVPETPEPIVESPSVQSTKPVSEHPVVLSQDMAASITVVVNKKYRLPETYAPGLVAVRGSSLRPEAAEAIERLLSNAEAAGNAVKIISGYRSYSTQQSVYSGYVNQYGQATADTFSARPGHSEHQTGLAVDVGNANGSCDLMTCFGTTPFGEWLKVNAYAYGFIIRYPEGKQQLTGYQYEPWHLRYVGDNTAWGIVDSQQTMDQFFNVQAGGY